MLRSSLVLVAILVLFTLTGCNDDPGAPLDSGAAETMEAAMADIAVESDLLTEEMVESAVQDLETAAQGKTGGGGTTAVITQEKSFSASRTCPAGGEMAVSGSIVRTADDVTGEVEIVSNGMRTRTDCTFIRNELTITVNGSSEWDKFRRRVNGVPDGLQTSHYEGSWTAVRSDGEERSCEFELSVVRDPAAKTLTIEGTLCGGPFLRKIAWALKG